MKSLLAFLGGAVAGAAVALLMAPEKGEVTRGRIRNMVNHGIDEIEDKAQKMRRKTCRTVERTLNDVADAVHKM